METLDILVANAGITRDNLLVQLSDAAWDEVIAVILSATFRLTRAAVKGMMRRRFGRVIAITSVVGVTGNPGQANYAASKAGMIGFTKALAAEVASRNVTANCIAPGFISSPMTDVLNEAQKTALMGKIPAGRPGTGEEGAVGRGELAGDGDANQGFVLRGPRAVVGVGVAGLAAVVVLGALDGRPDARPAAGRDAVVHAVPAFDDEDGAAAGGKQIGIGDLEPAHDLACRSQHACELGQQQRHPGARRDDRRSRLADAALADEPYQARARLDRVAHALQNN